MYVYFNHLMMGKCESTHLSFIYQMVINVLEVYCVLRTTSAPLLTLLSFLIHLLPQPAKLCTVQVNELSTQVCHYTQGT